MKIDLEKLMTVAQASEMLGISKQAIEKAIKDRRMREIRIGGHVFITTEEVNAYEVNAMKVKVGKNAATRRK